MNLLEATAAERRALAAKLRKLIRQSGKPDAGSVARIRTLLQELIKQVRQIIVTQPPERWAVQHAKTIAAEVEALIRRYSPRIAQAVGIAEEQAFEFGMEAAQQIITLWVQAPIASIVGVPRNLLEIAQGYTADLITNVSEEAIRKISAQITMDTLAGRSPWETMKTIAGRSLQDRSTFRTLFDRAEAIVRTETTTLWNASHQATLNQAAQSVPKLGKMWLTALDEKVRDDHLAMHGKVVPYNEPFVLPDGSKAMFPGDPSLPARQRANCRCRTIPIPLGEEDWVREEFTLGQEQVKKREERARKVG